MADIDWKKFLSYFKFYFLLIAILAVVLAALSVWKKGGTQFVRSNTECDTSERVFDYGEVLTEAEEESLRRLIAQREDETGCDIVLVTLDESLEVYSKGYEAQLGPLAPYEYTMVYADNFYDEHGFGYNKRWGDGVVLVDNWYREADGRVYSWLSTCGRAEGRFSSDMIDSLLNEALRNVDDDPYGAYKKYVNLFAGMMSGQGGLAGRIPVYAPLLAAGIAAAAYIGINIGSNKGTKTVAANTYVTGNAPRMKRREDLFLHKKVTRRHIERKSGGGGGGGGGHHTSSGGVSHGGGGHSR